MKDDINDTLQREGPDGVRRRHDAAKKFNGPTSAGEVDGPTDGEKFTIKVRRGELHLIASEAERALLLAKAPFYQRSGQIVTPIVEDAPAFNGRRTRVIRLKPVTTDMLRDRFSSAAKWVKWVRGNKKAELSPIDPPKDIANIVLAREGTFPRLTGVVTTPTLRPDGSVLAQPGYDPATGLLLVDPPPMPEIPERPTREDALTALALLDELLIDFPFVSDVDRSVGLSGLITPVVRGALQVAPLHAATAPLPGTGKSYWIDIASAITTGEIAAVLAAACAEEENEKRLSAELMEGQPIISIDNFNGDFGGDFLCQVIERPIIKPRVLGRSENKRIDNTFCVFGNGNNLRIVGDATRRVVLCSMDANVERPELRQFCRNPLDMVLADRGKYIAAAITIVRAYIAAGCPDPCPPLASFQDWTRLVRSPLVWLGRPDPVKTMDTARADDPKLSALRAVVAAWSRDLIDPSKPRSAGRLRDDAKLATALYDALAAVAADNTHREIDTYRLGYWLRGNRGRIVDGYKILGDMDKHTKQMTWWLVSAVETAGDGG